MRTYHPRRPFRAAVLSALFVALIVAAGTALAAGTGTAGRIEVKAVAAARRGELRPGELLRAPNFHRRVLHYQWYRCNRNARGCYRIKGATHRTYRIRTADIGHRLFVAADLQGDTTATSAPTGVVGLPLPVNTALPTITDSTSGSTANVTVGDSLVGTDGSWNYAVSFTHQWMDCTTASPAVCTAIAGATSLTYTVAQSDVGDTIELVITAYNYQAPGATNP